MENRPNPLDTRVRIISPENIAFEYRVAGPFRRLTAFATDWFIRLGIFGALVFISIFSGVSGLLGGSVAAIVLLLSWFALSWFYGLTLETLWNGQTVGKRMWSLRVISTDGRPINGVQATLRNLLRMADMGPMVSLQIFSADAPPMYWIPTGVVGLIVCLLTARQQRIGDLAANTMVVVEEPTWQPRLTGIDDPRTTQLAELIPPGFIVPATMAKTLAMYVERRKWLPQLRRSELAAHLATPLIAHFGLRPDTGADLLLCTLYERTFLASETQRKKSERSNKTLLSQQSLGQPLSLGSIPSSPPIASPVSPSNNMNAAPQTNSESTVSAVTSIEANPTVSSESREPT